MTRHRSCGVYGGVLKDIILLFKYRGYRVLGKEIAKFADLALGDEEGLWWDVDALVPVPLHPRRKRQRGFNQAGVISQELGELKDIDVLKGSLVKKKNVSPQTFLAGSERRANVCRSFPGGPHSKRWRGRGCFWSMMCSQPEPH